MTWNEVRKNFPNKFVKMEILGSHVKNNREIIDDVSVVKTLDDSKEAAKEYINCNENEIVFDTRMENIELKMVRNVGLRVGS